MDEHSLARSLTRSRALIYERALCTHGPGRNHLSTPESGAACLPACLLVPGVSCRCTYARCRRLAHELAIFMNTHGMRMARRRGALFLVIVSRYIFRIPRSLSQQTPRQPFPSRTLAETPSTWRGKRLWDSGANRVCVWVCVCSGRRYFHLDLSTSEQCMLKLGGM